MFIPRLAHAGKKLLALLAVVMLSGTLVRAQNLYNATVLPANPQTGVINYLQSLSLAGPNGSYSITSMQFGINWSDLTADQALFVTFYTGLDLSPGATNALATATQAGQGGFLLTAPAATGNYTYTLTFGSPVIVPSNMIGIEANLTDDTGGAPATGINGRFTATGPSVGSAPGFVWNDANGDGAYAGSEQTNFGQGAAYIRMSITGTAPVPEPGTWALLASGALLLLPVARRLKS